MKSEDNNIPRRDFLRFSAALTGATAAGVYLTTDARLKAQLPANIPLQIGGDDTGGHNYGY